MILNAKPVRKAMRAVIGCEADMQYIMVSCVRRIFGPVGTNRMLCVPDNIDNHVLEDIYSEVIKSLWKGYSSQLVYICGFSSMSP